MESQDMDSVIYDLVVIGAGMYGLAAAKTYLQLHPAHRVLTITPESTVGGTWSSERIYPGLRSNNLWGSLEYPDYPMCPTRYGVRECEHIPGRVLQRYFTNYAAHFGVLETIWFNTTVEAAEQMPDQTWILTTTTTTSRSHPDSRETGIVAARKLIVATGLTSLPNLPTYPGASSFTRPLFHAKDFAKNASLLDTTSRAVVIGGGKSAFDVAYAFAVSERCVGGVDLVIRDMGSGPVWMSPAYVTPFKRKIEELVLTRFLCWFSPCIWAAHDGAGVDKDGGRWSVEGVVRWFLHTTVLGAMVTRWFFGVLSRDVDAANGFTNGDEERGPQGEVNKLRPWYDALWAGSAIGIWNFERDFLGMVREGRVRVHHADVERLEGETVLLTNGGRIRTDVVVCATGWEKRALSMKFVGVDMGLGIEDGERRRLIAEADKNVLTHLSILRDQPEMRYTQLIRRNLQSEKDKKVLTTDNNNKRHEPLQLYRFMVPAQAMTARNIAFAGRVSAITNSTAAQLQALWICAFFDGNLSETLESKSEVLSEIMLHHRYEKWRQPFGYGRSVADLTFDSVPYSDLLMGDLGLDAYRKKTMLAEMFCGYKPRDYAEVMQEYRAAHRL